jgi:NDP-sugar pyrophosphorylase family protein
VSDFLLGKRFISTSTIDAKKSLPVAVILAGGLGTRLRATYAAGPKSMAPVAGRPFLDYLLRWLRSEGVREVILCVGYKRTQIQKYVGAGRKWGLRARYSIEKKLLGTAGALKKAQRMISGESLLVINGDTYVDVNLTELTEFHRSREALATLAAVPVKDGERYGSLQLDGKSRITEFLEKGAVNLAGKRKQGKRPINAGVYVFEKNLFRAMPAGNPMSLEKNVFPRLVNSKKVYGFVRGAYFLDIGVPRDYRRAQDELPKRFGIHDPS